MNSNALLSLIAELYTIIKKHEETIAQLLKKAQDGADNGSTNK